MTGTVSAACALLLALLLALPSAVGALPDEGDAFSKLQLHRRRACEAALLWRADVAAAASLDALLSPDAAAPGRVWSVTDGCDGDKRPCWSRDNVAVLDGELQLSLDSQGRGARIQLQATADGERQADGIFRLGVIAHLPKLLVDGAPARATIMFQLLHRNLTAAMATTTRRVSGSELWLTSSRNTSTFVMLPCSKSVDESLREFEFVWSADWLRWYVDGLMLWEEAITDIPTTTSDAKAQEDAVTVEFVYTMEEQQASNTSPEPSTSLFRIKSLGLSAANPLDPFCRPRHRSEMNCRQKTPWTPRLGSNQGYLSTDEVDAFIDEIQSTLPAYLVSVEDLGTSIDGRQLRALCLGRCQGGSDIPQTLYTGMHHSREPISMMNLVYTIDLLVADFLNGDLDMLHLLLSRQLWFILLVNPDGYALNEQKRMWTQHVTGQRKNARTGCSKVLDTGVDLNRNYDVCFDRDNLGSNPDVCAEDYRGPKPFSEPETRAVRSLVEDRGRDFTAALNYHSFGRFFNIPFACESLGTASGANASLFEALASEMARYNQFQYGQPWKESNLYTVNGETSDWMWQAHGIFAMSPEVGPDFDVSSELGFWPPRDQVPALSTELHYSNLHLARVSGPVYTLEVSTADVKPEAVEIGLIVANVGLRSGHSDVEVIATRSLDGTGDRLLAIPAGKLGSAVNVAVFSQSVSLPASLQDSDLRELYIVLRDALGCSIFRTSIGGPSDERKRTSRRVETWLPLHLPRCGSCEVYGVVDHVQGSDNSNSSSICADVSDITTLQGVNVRLAVRDDLAVVSTLLPASVVTSSPSQTPVNQSPGVHGAVQDTETSEDGSYLTASALLPIAGATLFIVAALLARLFVKRGDGSWRSKVTLKRSTVGENRSRQTGNAAYARVVVNDDSDEEKEDSDGVDVDADAAEGLNSDGSTLLASDHEPRASGRGRQAGSGLSPRQARSPSPPPRPSSSTRRSDQIA